MEKCLEAAFLQLSQLLTVSFGGNLTQTFLNRSFPSLCSSYWTESRLGHIILTFNSLWFTTVDTLKSYSRVVLFWVARLDQTYFSSSVFAFVLLALKRQPKTFRLNSTDKLLSNLYTQWLHKLKEKEKKKNLLAFLEAETIVKKVMDLFAVMLYITNFYLFSSKG